MTAPVISDELRGLMLRRAEALEAVRCLGARNSAGLSPEDAFAASVDYEVAQRTFRDLDAEYFRWVKAAAAERR